MTKPSRSIRKAGRRRNRTYASSPSPSSDMRAPLTIAVLSTAILCESHSLALTEIDAGQQASVNRVEGWPQWRGANRDGAATFTAPAAWPEKLNLKWRVDVGTGYAAPITVGDRVFAFSRQGEDEVMRALDAATGKRLWETKYHAPYKPIPAATINH